MLQNQSPCGKHDELYPVNIGLTLTIYDLKTSTLGASFSTCNKTQGGQLIQKKIIA